MALMEFGREWTLPLTSAHPSAAGGLRLRIDGDGSAVEGVEVIPGAMHRGAEKLFESRDYRALLALSDRHAWASSVHSELGLAELIESMLGIPVPTRARWLRVALAEATRVAHHLLWLAATAMECQMSAAADGYAARAAVVDALEGYTGMRVHHMIMAPGGVRWDCPPQWPARLADTLPACIDAADRIAAELAAAVPAGLATLNTEQARAYATSGPVARASGVHRDERLTETSGPYVELYDSGILRSSSNRGGDAAARWATLADEVRVSAACVSFAAEALAGTGGDVGVQLPKSIRVPEGHGYHATAAPGGTNGWYLVSRGGPTPYRLHLRTASFNNAQAMASALPGARWEWLPVAVMSMFLIAGDTDK